jgi:uncharacterized membrane protein
VRIGRLTEVAFEDLVAFAVVCFYALVIAIGKALWLPKEFAVRAVKALWPFAVIGGSVYGLWKLSDLIFYEWFGLEPW